MLLVNFSPYYYFLQYLSPFTHVCYVIVMVSSRMVSVWVLWLTMMAHIIGSWGFLRDESSMVQNFFGACKWKYVQSIPLGDNRSAESDVFQVYAVDLKNYHQDIDDYVHMPLSLSQVNEKLALGIVRGIPSASVWAAREDNSWQYPIHHPRRNKTNCLLLNNASVSAPFSAYAYTRNLTADFFLIYKRNVLIHESGIVASQCGYYQALEGCETVFKFIGRRWHEKCLRQLQDAALPWHAVMSPSSALVGAAANKSHPSIPVSIVPDKKAKRKAQARATKPADKQQNPKEIPLHRFCKDDRSEEWSYVQRVMVISSVWDSNYHHFLIDVLPRLIHFLPFLQAHPDILLHIRRSERYSKLAIAQRAVAMKLRILELLGLDPQRLVSGPVVAEEVYLPRSMMCNFPVLNALEVRLLAKTLLQRALQHPSREIVGRSPYFPFDTFPAQPLQSQLLTHIRHQANITPKVIFPSPSLYLFVRPPSHAASR